MFVFFLVGLTVDRFVMIMSSKMSARDEDDYVRRMFLAFDMQCMCHCLYVMTMAFSRCFELRLLCIIRLLIALINVKLPWSECHV